jgi:RimJ/RimL family protein N-acetyltransferase
MRLDPGPLLSSYTQRDMPAAPILRLGDTMLGPLRQDDAVTVAASKDKKIRAAFGRRAPTTPAQARQRIDEANRLWEEGRPTWQFAVRRADSPELIGWLTVKVNAQSSTHQIECWISPDQRRKGHGARALELGCRYAFCDLGAPFLEAEIDSWNKVSMRLARSAGFRRTRHFRWLSVDTTELRRRSPQDATTAPVGARYVFKRSARAWRRLHSCQEG